MNKEQYQKLKEVIIKAVPEIIGRDITLEDILKILEMFGKGIVFGGSNNSFYSKTQNKIKWLDIHWEFNKPFKNQSDETKQFLYNILCKN